MPIVARGGTILVEAGVAAVIERYQLDRVEAAGEAEAAAFCAALTRSHYENFTVVSWFLPRRLRPHFQAIYAYCRVSDDLADEVADADDSLALLDRWRGWLHACFEGRAEHPVFVALRRTARDFDLPRAPFDRLLDAFIRDRRQTRYATFADLLTYCECSANPVGHLVLYLGGYRDRQRQRLADATCTALQLINFHQDVARDLERDRIYLPTEDLARFGVSEDQLRARRVDANYRALLRFQVDRTRELFRAGLPLLDLLDGRLRRQVGLFSAGGWAIADRIERLDYDTLTSRPALSGAAKVELMLRALLGGRPTWA